MEGHRHRWTRVDFYLSVGGPMLRQACDCGAERRLRAFERYWDPALSEGGLAAGRSRLKRRAPQ